MKRGRVFAKAFARNERPILRPRNFAKEISREQRTGARVVRHPGPDGNRSGEGYPTADRVNDLRHDLGEVGDGPPVDKYRFILIANQMGIAEEVAPVSWKLSLDVPCDGSRVFVMDTLHEFLLTGSPPQYYRNFC